jgi:hypothetical protein
MKEMKPFPLNENYLVSEDGDIYSVKSKKYLKQCFNGRYYQVTLYKGALKTRETWLVHRIVAKTWIPNPECKPEVNHKNAVKVDNRVSNLEWSTRKENIDHSIENQLMDYAARNHVGSSKRVKIVYDNGKTEFYDTAKEAAMKLKVNYTHLTLILNKIRSKRDPNRHNKLKAYVYYLEGK